MVQKTPSLSYHFVGFLDALDYLFFGAIEFVDDLEESKLRLGKRLFIVVIAAVVIIILAILIAIIVGIVRLNSNSGSGKSSGSSTTSKPTVTQPVPASIITSTASSAPTEASAKPSGASSASTKTPSSSSRSSITTTTQPPTTTQTPTYDSHCMIVGDMLNLGEEEEYKDEQRMINDVAGMLLGQKQSTAGIWGYGHVYHSDTFRNAFEKTITNDWSAFSGYLDTMMKFNAQKVHPSGGNPCVFSEINTTVAPKGNSNCLVFLSAMTDVKGYKIAPDYQYKRIVVVNLAGGDFSKIVDEKRGSVVEVSPPYNDEEKKNARKIYDEIQKGF